MDVDDDHARGFVDTRQPLCACVFCFATSTNCGNKCAKGRVYCHACKGQTYLFFF
jgi:hypothetical protein